MSNLRRYNVYLGNNIAKMNSDDDAEEVLDEIYKMSVDDVINTIVAAVIERCEIAEGDNETLEKKLNEMTFAELFEIPD